MRYERKYYSHNLAFSAIEKLILNHPLAFRTVFAKRQVNNVYFDTRSWRTYYENLAGISHRVKYRLRWYGLNHQIIKKAQFELKKKENLLGSKVIYPTNKPLKWENISQVINEIPTIQQLALFPVLVNSYERYYYQSADQHFRLTVDYNLRCASYDIHRIEPQPFPQVTYVIELKYNQEFDGQLDEFSQFWPLRNSRFSKYVNGMQLVYG